MSDSYKNFRLVERRAHVLDNEAYAILANHVYIDSGEYFSEAPAGSTLIIDMDHELDYMDFVYWLTSRGIRPMTFWLDGVTYKIMPMVGRTTLRNKWIGYKFRMEIPVIFLGMVRD